MSAIGGRFATLLLRPLLTIVVAPGCVRERTACNTGVIDCVVKAHDTTTLSGAMPRELAAARCELVSWRSGSSAQALALGSSGSVDAPLTHSGDVRLVRKYVVSGVTA